MVACGGSSSSSSSSSSSRDGSLKRGGSKAAGRVMTDAARLALVEYLLSAGADPFARDGKHGRNALHLAVVSGRREVVAMLLQHDSDSGSDSGSGSGGDSQEGASSACDG